VLRWSNSRRRDVRVGGAAGGLDRGAGRELPTGADEVLVADMYKAMVRARSGDAAIQVTLPGGLRSVNLRAPVDRPQ
jgi:hypothetical protein